MPAEPRAAPGALMAAEIAEQPAALQRLLDRGRPAIAEVAAQLARRRPRFVLLAARGTSDNAALYGKYLVEVLLGLPAGLASPSTMTVYGARPDLRDVLFVAISQSGASPDLVGALTVARERGAVTLALTNTPGSPLARAAELHVDVLAGPERSVAATKTYTAELLALYLLVQALRGAPAEAARALPERASLLLGHEPELAAVAARWRAADRLVTTARGFAYPTACEAALKLAETSYLSAHAYSAADLLHGPLAMLDAGTPVIAIVTSGPGGRAMPPALARLREARADLLLIGPGGAGSGARAAIPLPADLPEELAAILAALPLQQLAWHLALARRLDPDRPRRLRKVTETW